MAFRGESKGERECWDLEPASNSLQAVVKVKYCNCIPQLRIPQDSSTSFPCVHPAKSECLHPLNAQAVYVRATNADPAKTLLANTRMHLTEFLITMGSVRIVRAVGLGFLPILALTSATARCTEAYTHCVYVS